MSHRDRTGAHLATCFTHNHKRTPLVYSHGRYQTTGSGKNNHVIYYMITQCIKHMKSNKLNVDLKITNSTVRYICSLYIVGPQVCLEGILCLYTVSVYSDMSRTCTVCIFRYVEKVSFVRCYQIDAQLVS